MKRWVLLEHRVSKNILKNRHFDLLIEEKTSCRSWRLEDKPLIDGPSVKAVSIPPHKLYWLDRKESLVFYLIIHSFFG